MTVSESNYVVASKKHPLMFYGMNGFETDNFKKVMLSNEDSAKMVLETLKEPNNYKILEIKIHYEI